MTLFYIKVLTLFSILILNSIPSSADENCPFKDLALRKVNSVRDLKLLKDIPCKKLTREEIKSYIKEAIEKKVPLEKLKNEEKILKYLELIPQNYNYKEELLKLYTDQVGGFYDPEKEYFATASWIPQNLQIPINFHELTHALQDQHFNLDKFTDPNLSSDELLVRSSIAEGDASLTMLLAGSADSKIDKNTISNFRTSTIKGSMENQSMVNSPLAIRALLIFPYSFGTEFVYNTYKSKGWKGVDDLYKNPPKSSLEVFNAEGSKAANTEVIQLSCSDENSNAKIIYEDTLGFLYLNYVFGEDVLASSPKVKWQGDKICLMKSDQEEIIIWKLKIADNLETALNFLKTKYKAAETSANLKDKTILIKFRVN